MAPAAVCTLVCVCVLMSSCQSYDIVKKSPPPSPFISLCPTLPLNLHAGVFHAPGGSSTTHISAVWENRETLELRPVSSRLWGTHFCLNIDLTYSAWRKVVNETLERALIFFQRISSSEYQRFPNAKFFSPTTAKGEYSYKKCMMASAYVKN